MNEKISVLIPVFNRENFILRAINSIVFQTYENLQIIIYDDGSNDESREQPLEILELIGYGTFVEAFIVRFRGELEKLVGLRLRLSSIPKEFQKTELARFRRQFETSRKFGKHACRVFPKTHGYLKGFIRVLHIFTHPTNTNLVSCSPKILSLRNSVSRNP